MKTTCDRCNVTWSGSRIEHCCSCKCSFSGTTAGDMHRTGRHDTSSGPDRRRCLTRDEMLARGLEPRENNYGTEIWGRAATWKDPFWATEEESAGLIDDGWVVVPPATNEALENEESA